MIVGYGRMTFHLHGVRSLKEKRKIVKALISRLQRQFNASVAEVGDNDVHQRAQIGFSLVGNDAGVIDSKMDKFLNMAENLGIAEMTDAETELMTL
ncbi:MAG: hypothetical protein CSA22_08570 [Deltaproteobacteria bacterium]|nr:MAG: hypothetical protein CSA22_08570 [Deltaproteobacteria bacterium]